MSIIQKTINRLKEKNAEGYIDVCVGVVVFSMIVVIALNIFSFITVRVQLDEIADRLITVATYSGEFGDKYIECETDCYYSFYEFETDYGAEEYYGGYGSRVQLGDAMWVEVSYTTKIKGLGIVSIPIQIKTKKTGISQKYWK